MFRKAVSARNHLRWQCCGRWPGAVRITTQPILPSPLSMVRGCGRYSGAAVDTLRRCPEEEEEQGKPVFCWHASVQGSIGPTARGRAGRESKATPVPHNGVWEANRELTPSGYARFRPFSAVGANGMPAARRRRENTVPGGNVLAKAPREPGIIAGKAAAPLPRSQRAGARKRSAGRF